MQNPLVSIVIPNWNGIEHLPICLESLQRQAYSPIEIIIADNASTDGSQAFLAQHYPLVRLVQLPENRGFTGACNVGMQAAQGEIIILLNNDTETHPHWVSEVVAAFDRHPEVGLVASKMLLFDQRDTLHTAGDFVRVNGLPGNRGVWQKDSERYNREEYVFSACGGSAAYRRKMLDDVGVLWDKYFFSCEDVDLGWRAQLAGWRCVYAPKAIVYHRLAATGGGVTASYYDGRNFIWLIARNFPGTLAIKHWRQIAGAQVRLAWEALKAFRGAAARARLRGMLAGITGLPIALRGRGVIQKGRRASMEYIESMLSPVDHHGNGTQ